MFANTPLPPRDPSGITPAYLSVQGPNANDAARNVYGDLLPNPQGKGSDYGVKFTLLTVAQRVADLETTLRNFDAIQNVPEDVYAPEWSVNLIQTYSFARETKLLGLPLGGISIGGSMNARGKAISGFAKTSASVLDPTRPYHAPSYESFGAWVTCQRKLFKNRVDWRVQANVRNLFDAYTVFPLRTVDARDGTQRGVNVIYRLSEPRAYTFTSTFRF